jgi:hypothetical protein
MEINRGSSGEYHYVKHDVLLAKTGRMITAFKNRTLYSSTNSSHRDLVSMKLPLCYFGMA